MPAYETPPPGAPPTRVKRGEWVCVKRTMWSFSFFYSLFASQVLRTTYWQTDAHQGSDFLNAFRYEAIADPTHGRVNYVDSWTAAAQNLTYASGDHFVLRADYKTTLNPNGPGRNSVRLISNKQYSANTVMVFNIRHMPVGCGTWPALWTVGPDWPNQGEIDILEGVNDVGPNQITLHTNAGCTMPSSRQQTGSPIGNDCNVYTTNNAGCSVKLTNGNTYGRAFNNQGGGWLAVERTNSYIKAWFWSRSAGNVPSDVRHGEAGVTPENWGTPAANFPSTSCNLASKFGWHSVVINLTFCGDWAGSVYGSSGCPSTCVDYVNYNPSAFKDAYFDFKWMKVYGL